MIYGSLKLFFIVFLENHIIRFKYNIFIYVNFSKSFHEYIWMENQDYKNKNIKRKYRKNMRNNQFLKVESSL